jgi:hypothetical protein
MPELIAVLGLLCGLQEKNAAEQLFSRMEDRLSKAKTVRFTYGAFRGDCTGRFLLSEGNRARIEIKEERFNRKLVSDGATVADVVLQSKPTTRKAPANLTSNLLHCLTRFDLHTGFSTGIATDWVMEGHDVRQKVALRDFKLLEKKKLGDRELDAIEFVRSYTIAETIPMTEIVILWIDPATSLPVLRRIERERGKGWEETFLDLKLDGVIDPKEFAVPER